MPIPADDPLARSADVSRENLAKLAALFPGVVTEGATGPAVDVEALKALVGEAPVDEGANASTRFGLHWHGKDAARRLALTPSAGTLRPTPEESVDWESTKNLMIEGDNLEVLKLLQKSYRGRVKLIYIDPPYNTGKDFVYPDDFRDSVANYKKLIAEPPKTNRDTTGRFHTDWLNMMYSRLTLARELLTEDGLIFMSISDAEAARLMELCDEVFGDSNFIGNAVWNSTKSVTNTALLSVGHTHTLIYAREKEWFVGKREDFRLAESSDGFSNPDEDPRGPWKADPFQVGGERPNQLYEIVNEKTGERYRPNPGNSWKNEHSRYLELIADGRIVFGSTGEAGPQRKRFLSEALERGRVSKTWWDDLDTTTNATRDLKELFDGTCPFSNPKPVDLVQRIIQLGAPHEGDVVLDFFAGSGTTGHAVMQQVCEDGIKRVSIVVQLPEPTEDGDYRTIAHLTRERLRRAGAKVKKDHPDYTGDTGFRTFKLDTSNVAAWSAPRAGDVTAEEVEDLFEAHQNAVVTDRTDDDLFWEVLLKHGLPEVLTEEASADRVEIGAETLTVRGVAGGAVMACLDRSLTADHVEPLAQAFERMSSLTEGEILIVLRDAAFADDATKLNLIEAVTQGFRRADEEAGTERTPRLRTL